MTLHHHLIQKSTRSNLRAIGPPVAKKTGNIIGEARTATGNIDTVIAPIILMIHLTIGIKIDTRRREETATATMIVKGQGRLNVTPRNIDIGSKCPNFGLNIFLVIPLTHMKIAIVKADMKRVIATTTGIGVGSIITRKVKKRLKTSTLILRKKL